jgi:tetratricopeptide (TPR) repeat protein
MDKKEKIRQKARATLEKAEILLDKRQYKKSAQFFQKSGDMYGEDLDEWKIAEQCFYYASKNYHRLGGDDDRNFHRASLVERKAGNMMIATKNFSKARDYFDIAAKSILKSEAKDQHNMAITNIGWAFFCYYLQGRLDDGIAYVKRFRDQFYEEDFNDHILIQIVRKLSKALLNNKEQYVDDIIDAIEHKEKIVDDITRHEMLLLKETLIVALTTLMMSYSLEAKKSTYERDDLITLETKLDFHRLEEFLQYSFVPRQFKSLEVTKFSFTISDNIGTKEKPQVPVKLDVVEFKTKLLPITFRSNFPGEGFIGPIELTLVIDGIYQFTLKSERHDLKVVSPNAQLGVQLIPQKTPVMNQTFPLEVVVANNSEGDTMEIEVQFEFPDSLKMMRGTMSKKIYSLRPNEEFKWQIMVKANESGEIPISTHVQFIDGDGNKKGPFTAVLPLEINL